MVTWISDSPVETILYNFEWWIANDGSVHGRFKYNTLMGHGGRGSGTAALDVYDLTVDG